MTFVTPEGSFKPIVVFFGPTNSSNISNNDKWDSMKLN